MKILELKDIIHDYNGRRVLDIPSLFIEKGNIYAFVGPNGSGKTTLLSIMSLILKPKSGRIYFKGRQVKYDINIRQAMTMVFQNPYLFNMSVSRNVAYGLYSRKISKKERNERVKAALELVGLSSFEKRGSKELSGGEAQLVALARGLAIEPAVLFLDEPTANVDSEHIKRLENIISRINKEMETTVVITTHNLSQAYKMTDKVLSIFKGSLIPSKIHNLFSGRIIKKDKSSPYFDTGKMKIWVPDNIRAADTTHITIDPEDIIVSKEPFASSARNLFKGVITKIIKQGGKIYLEANSLEVFGVIITESSLFEMGLNIGSQVYLTFKASSVHSL